MLPTFPAQQKPRTIYYVLYSPCYVLATPWAPMQASTAMYYSYGRSGCRSNMEFTGAAPQFSFSSNGRLRSRHSDQRSCTPYVVGIRNCRAGLHIRQYPGSYYSRHSHRVPRTCTAFPLPPTLTQYFTAFNGGLQAYCVEALIAQHVVDNPRKLMDKK